MTKDDEKYIHPLLVKIIRKLQKGRSADLHTLQKNEHEMSWRNSGNGVNTPVALSSMKNSMQYRNGASGYDNNGFQDANDVISAKSRLP